MKLRIPTVCARVAAYHERLRPYVRQPDAALESWAWPGGYPIFYLTEAYGDAEVSCPECATNAHEYSGCKVTHADVNWEDPELYCANCNRRIESAYAEKRPDHD